MTLNERAEIRRETFCNLTNSADVPTAPSEGGRNLYALSKNSGIYTKDITDFVQNVGTGEISFKVTGRDPFFGTTIGTLRGVKIPVNGQDIAVKLTNPLFVKNFVSYFGEDDKAVKGYKNYQANKFVIPADELEGVSYITFRFGLVEETQEVGSVHSTKIKVEYGNVYTDWSPAPEDLGWSTTTLVPTQQQRYLWKFEYIYYSDDSVEVTQPVNLSIAGADADTTGVTDAINQTNQTVANLQNSVSQAQSDLATVSSNLTQARQNLESSIASVNTKAQAVETTLAQVQSTANANSQKTATLENDLDGLSAKFSSLKVGAVNLLKNSKVFEGTGITGTGRILDETYQGCAIRYYAGSNFCDIAQFSNCVVPKAGSTYVMSFWAKGNGKIRAYFYGNPNYLRVLSGSSSQGASTSAGDGSIDFTLTEDWQRYWVVYKLKSSFPTSDTTVAKHLLFRHLSSDVDTDEVYIAGAQLECGSVSTDYSPNEADLELKVADYKQTADQNYASLQTTVQNLDGTVTANKAIADQTAQGFSTRIESLETYKDGETTRANQYFESAKTETARQLTAERTAIAKDYVAKSMYTSDVTGIRNDLTATTTTANTTKINLASYQASNDQAVASLQSSLQTTDGNVSNLQTQINAVPGQITSAVSAVEGKIPTEIGGTNLYALSSNAALSKSRSVSKLDLDVATGDITFTISGSDPFVGKAVSANASYDSSMGQKIPVKADKAMAISLTNELFTKNYVSFFNDNDVALKGYKSFPSSKFIIPTSDLSGVSYIVLRYGVQDNIATIGQNYSTKLKIEYGNIYTDWSPAPEDYDNKLASAQSEIKQTTDAISAAVSSVETKANTAQSTANTAVSKADAAQASVNTLDSTTVKTASLNLDNNGFVTKVGKTINGNKFATMIAQDANNVKIIADEMQVTADMIVDGAVTANKLNVNNLSAVNSNLGAIKGGSLLLQENKTASSSVDSWGTFNRPAHKQGLYMDNHGLASSGAIQRKNGSESTPTDMPLAVLQSGELRFLVVDYNDNLENVLHYGLSDPDYGAIRFEIDSELKRRLTMTSSGYLNFQATNYTNWTSTGVSGCEYMIQGRLVLVNYDVTFNSAGTHTIGSIPQEFTKKSLMMTAKAWTITPRDKNIQLNSDGSLHILDAEANVNYRGTLVFSY